MKFSVPTPRFLPRFATLALAALLLGALALPGLTQTAGAQDRWAEKIAHFVSVDRANPPTPGGVLFAGSSTITIWNSRLAADFPGHPVVGRGFGGSTIPDQIRHIDRIVLPHKPRLIVFYCGENDIASGRPPAQVASDFARFCELVFAELPETRILYVGMKPSPKRWQLQDKFDQAEALLADYCSRAFRVARLDIKAAFLGADGKPRAELYAQDELHLGPEGYRVLRDLVEPLLATDALVVPAPGPVPAAVDRAPAPETAPPGHPDEGVLVDFGASESVATPAAGAWNNLTAELQRKPGRLPLVDVRNRPTGITLEVVRPFSGANTSGARAHDRYPAAAVRDSLFANIARFGTQENVVPELLLSGLDAGLRYTLTFFASRMGSQDNRTARYAIDGAISSAVELDAANNTGRVVTTEPLAPAPDGTLRITITPAESNTNAHRFTYLGVLEIQTAP